VVPPQPKRERSGAQGRVCAWAFHLDTANGDANPPGPPFSLGNIESEAIVRKGRSRLTAFFAVITWKPAKFLGPCKTPSWRRRCVRLSADAPTPPPLTRASSLNPLPRLTFWATAERTRRYNHTEDPRPPKNISSLAKIMSVLPLNKGSLMIARMSVPGFTSYLPRTPRENENRTRGRGRRMMMMYDV